MTVTRGEQAAVVCDIHPDIQPEETAAIMLAISDFAKAKGWNPGLLSMEYNAIEMRRRGMVPARIPDHLRRPQG